MNEDFNREEFQELLKSNLTQFDAIPDAYLVGGLVIGEWMAPDGSRYLTRNAIGNVSEWQAQGYLFSTLHAEQGWDLRDNNDEDPD